MSWRLVKISLIHDECWSELTFHHENMFVGDLGLVLYPNNKTSEASVFIKSNRENDVIGFMYNIKNSKSVIKINKVFKIRASKLNHLYFLNFTGIYGNTVATILYEERVPFFKYCFNDGVEYWSFIVKSKEQLASITEKLRDISRIKHIRIEKLKGNYVGSLINGKTIQFLYSYLTQSQLKILSIAYSHGYYDYPHKITISELARLTNVSPSTVEQSLRSSERKIMDFVLAPYFNSEVFMLSN